MKICQNLCKYVSLHPVYQADSARKTFSETIIDEIFTVPKYLVKDINPVLIAVLKKKIKDELDFEITMNDLSSIIEQDENLTDDDCSDRIIGISENCIVLQPEFCAIDLNVVGYNCDMATYIRRFKRFLDYFFPDWKLDQLIQFNKEK